MPPSFDYSTTDAIPDINGALDVADRIEVRATRNGVPGTFRTALSRLATLLFGKVQSTTAAVTLPASTTAKAPLNCLPGAAPTAPVDGDIWIEGTSIKLRISGATRTIASS